MEKSITNSVYTIGQLQGLLKPVLEKNSVRKAVLFGSYSKGTATVNSDVDLMVDSGLKGLRFFGLLDEISELLACPVDLIDVQDILPDSPVDREIQKTGVVIYE